ncbi:unnamed protein product [Calypogeia fissa]
MGRSRSKSRDYDRDERAWENDWRFSKRFSPHGEKRRNSVERYGKDGNTSKRFSPYSERRRMNRVERYENDRKNSERFSPDGEKRRNRFEGSSSMNGVGSMNDIANSFDRTMRVMSPVPSISSCGTLGPDEAYCSFKDAFHFPRVPGLKLGMMVVNNRFLLKVRPHADVPDGFLAIHDSGRKIVVVSRKDDVHVARFHPKILETLILELEYLDREEPEPLDVESLELKVCEEYEGQLMMVGQHVSVEYLWTEYTFIVKAITLVEEPKESIVDGKQNVDCKYGLFTKDTMLILETPTGSGTKIKKNPIRSERSAGCRSLFKTDDFSFQKLGIGGLDDELKDIFRRAFASRLFPPDVIQKLGIKHVKGMLLFGPPGTGKTLIARQIGKMLNGKEPKVVNGPDVLHKWVGESEEKVRKLFEDAEKDQERYGDDSELHVIIFDEIDAICRARGSRDRPSVLDTVVNQLLTKIDGVKSLNNILLIGMTNRKELLDKALLRPGRLELQIEIGLPDEEGRAQILQIHSSIMKQSSCLSDDVDLESLAARTQNFSGADLEGLVRSATSFALRRHIDFDNLNKAMDANTKVTLSDFERAMDEIKPAFGKASGTLERRRVNSILGCGPGNDHVHSTAKNLVDKLKTSEHTPLLSCLLTGPRGSGKTALAETIALESGAQYIQIISAESMVGLPEFQKCSMISNVFEDAYRSPLGIIIMDDIERIIGYVSIGPKFSNGILQTLLVLIKKLPPKGSKLMIIGTTSMKEDMGDVGILSAFQLSISVPNLNSSDIKKVLLA